MWRIFACAVKDGKISHKKEPVIQALIKTYMAGNSIQQYFPHVRCKTQNEPTSLILDGASKSAVLVVPKGKTEQGGKLMKDKPLSRNCVQSCYFVNTGCGFG